MTKFLSLTNMNMPDMLFYITVSYSSQVVEFLLLFFPQ